ncbi:adhesion G-protein coupled receptor D2-like isoform X2 [Xyrauchen texanus]|uniref:adhesion G-protein coupled receptor D2-like isoform X2 n=1 Tax=Xyrauchen texanus TaxID=154827 RepID=UPI002242B2FB|nr:adhesion G-protein coupled receptor D2-like isoform X2 [Xyrauchen texanus]
MDTWTQTTEDRHMANSRWCNYKYTYVKMPSVLFGVILANAMIVGMCEPTQSWSDGAERGILDSADSNILLRKDAVYQFVNTSFSFEQALRYCRGQFGALTTSGVKEDEEGAQQLLSNPVLKGPIWFGTNKRQNSTAHLAHSKQTTVLSGLSFQSKDSFACLNISFPTLSTVSVCMRLQWDPQHENISTVFSYAAPVFINEFQLRGKIDESKGKKSPKKVRLALLIKGQHNPYKAEFPLDKDWHHVCATWRASDGFWAIYVDGKEGDSGIAGQANPRDIHGKGIFIVGQDQDTFGGTFTEPFVGNLTDLNIWDVALELKQVQALSACSALTNHRAIFRWQDRKLTVNPSVKNVSSTLNCPGPLKPTQVQKEECKVFMGWSGDQPQYRTVSCTDSLPFICTISKERYLKMKEMRESMSSNPSPFMQCLMQLGMTTEDVLLDTVDGPSWTSVSHLLNMSEQAVLKEQKELEGRDMISLIHVLSRAADLPSTANQSRHDAEKFGQSFITLAELLLSQDNASKWDSIKEVVKGPMAVIQIVDRMMSNLDSLLMEDTDSVQIHSQHIKLQVQQKILSESSEGSVASEFCGSDMGKRDCISVPTKNIKELHNSGFKKVTLLNTWYSNVKCLSEREENITFSPIVTDGYHSYRGTVLGSSIISSTVLGDGQPISMAIHFTLQHRSQNTSVTIKPICAFWDFDLKPERGGWSTKGCAVISTHDNSTSCYCNHTTNFAVLLQLYDVQIFGLIGSGVSLCGLILTLILFVAVGVPKSDRTTIHKNLIVALAVAQLLFIFSDWAVGNQEACWLVTALLHLFYLSSFCWMLVEGLLLWSKVVSVNISEERRMKLYYVLGWGLPVVIVAVTLVASLDRYKAQQYCWLNIQSYVIWAFAGPIIFVFAVNSVVLFRVVMVTVASARRRAKMLTPSSDSKLQTLDLTWVATRPVLILLPVLGLTWICGVLVHLSVYLAYLFITLNAFQGLYIFLVYAVYNSEVRNAIRRIQEKQKALSFTNCSQPISFLPSQKSASGSWVHSLPTQSSRESSENGTPITSSTSNSLVLKNERFKDESIVCFSNKQANGSQVVQLTAFKPSDC